eukprot:gene10182-11266_t
MNALDGVDADAEGQASQLLHMLLQLRESDQAAYQRAVQSLGLESVAAAIERQLGSSPSASEQSEPTSNFRLLTQEIAKLRGEGQSGGEESIKIGTAEPPKNGISITPLPGFCFKTKETVSLRKVFINVVQHEAVGEPAIAKRLDHEGKEVEGLNVPMSVGPMRVENDKKGAPSSVYDVIVHPSVVADCLADPNRHRDFVCQLCIQSIEQKYGGSYDRRYKVPKLSYMGSNVASQVVQDRSKQPSIQEVQKTAGERKTSKPILSSNSSTNSKLSAQPEDELIASLHWMVDNSPSNGDSHEKFDRLCEHLLLKVSSGANVIQSESIFGVVKMVAVDRDYVEPTDGGPQGAFAIAVEAEITCYEASAGSVTVNVSPYRIEVKVVGYENWTCYLPVVVLPERVFYKLLAMEGYVSRKVLQIFLPVDQTRWEASADPGSKPWLLAQALARDGHELNRKEYVNHNSSDENSVVLPESRFHLSLPDDVDPYTGVKIDNFVGESSTREVEGEEDELPEDRFHQKDAASSFLINQREQARKDKWAKHEREKAERANDPNVEYIEMEDFRPGGKFGPQLSTKASVADGGNENQTGDQNLSRAADVLGQTLGPKQNALLQSHLWTQLLD